MNNIPLVFTCDIDWAPEFIIKDTLKFFCSLNIELTLFATHESDAVKNAGLEIGIHPYLSRVVEQNHANEIYKLKNIYKNSVWSRSHRNYFGYNTPKYLKQHGLKYDISVVNWLNPTSINKHFTGLKTLTYSWEDGLHFDYELDLSPEKIPYDNTSYHIYNVHPVSIYLNQNNEELRKKALYNVNDFTSISENQINKFRNKSYGIRNIIKDFVYNKKSISLKDFAKLFC